jgi:FAD/FMN-containing dehydrogenase
MDSKHTDMVERLQAQIRSFFERQVPFRIFHGNTNATRIMSFKRSETLDVSGLNRVVSIDTKRKTAIVEPNVPMDELLRQTLAAGLLPPVVMEFPGITVGGGIQGGAGESSSWKWGCFNETCNWYEMVLADGKVVRASRRRHSDLFFGTAGSFGSLGVVTAAEIKLETARRYVTLTYHRVRGFQEATTVIRDAAASQTYDYIDGIMFSAKRGVIMLGRLSDEAAGPLQRFSRPFDEWFYLHADKLSRRAGDTTESVPVADYLFRYDRGAFWVGRYAYERSGMPFNRATRFLADHIMHTRKLYEALQESGASQQYLIQDMAVPEKKAVEFMKYIDATLGAYPLWLCPMKPDTASFLLSNSLKTQLAINVGIWSGSPIVPYEAFVSMNRVIEKKLRSLGGKKWFYAQSYYTESEFWRIYDKQEYDSLRRKYRAESLPDVYDKIRAKDGKPVNIKRAAWKTIFGIAKLPIRD